MSRILFVSTVPTLLFLNILPGCSSDQTTPKQSVDIVSERPDVSQLGLEWPSFSPDGSRIVCILRNRGTGGLYRVPLILDAPDMRPRPLAELPGAVEGLAGLSWRPDGKEIAFTLIERKTNHFGIWLFDIEKNRARPLVLPGNMQILQCPLFSHDGRSLLFRDAIGYNLLLCNVATGNVRRLPDIGETTRIGYGWGADDKTIWASVSTGLYRVSIDQAPPKLFESAPNVAIQVPSPDGKLLACLIEGTGPIASQYELALYDTTTGVLEDLAAATNQYQLSWRPDGKALAYEKDGRVWVYDLDTAAHRAVTPADVEAQFPFWDPGDRTLWCVIDNRAICQVTDGGLKEAFSLDKTDPTKAAPSP